MSKLTEIREALEAATPGPWISHEDSVCSDKGAWVCQMFEGDESIGDEVEPFENDYNNAEFIAHAPEYITYLLQLVETQAQALEFYADEETYEQQWKDHGYWADPEIDDDRGQRAREAIKLTQV